MIEKLPFVVSKLALSLLLPITDKLQLWRDGLRYLVIMQQHYKPRPDDIFIATAPKSGTTLMQMMLYQLTSDGNMDIPHIQSVTTWFEADITSPFAEPEALESLPSPRIFKTHLAYEHLPKQGKFIYIVRDVRDVAVSAYHHFCLMTGRESDKEQFVDRMLRQPRSPWFRHLESWWPHRKDANVLFLTFEEIIQDLEGTVLAVARFCGIPVNEKDLPRIVERCGFAFMKEHNDKFDPRLRQFSQKSGQFIRQGKAGLGLRELTQSQEGLLKRRLSELALRVGDTAGSPLFGG